MRRARDRITFITYLVTIFGFNAGMGVLFNILEEYRGRTVDWSPAAFWFAVVMALWCVRAILDALVEQTEDDDGQENEAGP